jgi:hypothetical protein
MASYHAPNGYARLGWQVLATPVRWQTALVSGSGWPEHSGLGEGETVQEVGLIVAVPVQAVRDDDRRRKNAGVSIG